MIYNSLLVKIISTGLFWFSVDLCDPSRSMRAWSISKAKTIMNYYQENFYFGSDELEVAPVICLKERKGNEPEALYMLLHSEPTSGAAKTFIRGLAATIYHRARLRNRPTQKFIQALGALVSDLLEGQAMQPPVPCRRHMTPNSFSGRAVGYKSFRRLLNLARQTHFIDVIEGKWFRRTSNGEGQLTVIKAKPKLIRLALEFGITPANRSVHFKRLPRPGAIPDPVKLSRKRITIRGAKQPKSVMAIRKDDARASAEAARVNRLNAYFAKQDITPDCHFAFQRQFHDGDAEDFDWNKGGRLYSLGCNSYQQLPVEDRAAIRINSEAVVELDISASHPRILHAQAGQPIDPTIDPYEGTRFPRDVVKDFVTMTLGHTGFHRAWSPRKKEEYKEAGIDLHLIKPADPEMLLRQVVVDELANIRFVFDD